MTTTKRPTAKEKRDAGTPRKRGRPETRIIKLDATPERVAHAIFSAVKKPDSKLRKPEGRHE